MPIVTSSDHGRAELEGIARRLAETTGNDEESGRIRRKLLQRREELQLAVMEMNSDVGERQRKCIRRGFEGDGWS